MNLRRALGAGGLTATACLACCAPPIIAALGLTAGLATLAGLFVGLTGAVTIVVVGGAVIEGRRRRRRTCAAPPVAQPVVVAPPRRRRAA